MVGGICGKAAHPNRIRTAHLTILQRAKRESEAWSRPHSALLRAKDSGPKAS